MTTINPTVENSVAGDITVKRYTWANMANGDDGAPIPDDSQYADRSVQVYGTFGVGGTVVWEGTLTAASSNYRTLSDPQGNTLSFTSASLKEVAELIAQVRPRVSAGDGTTSITVVAMMRRSPRN